MFDKEFLIHQGESGRLAWRVTPLISDNQLGGSPLTCFKVKRRRNENRAGFALADPIGSVAAPDGMGGRGTPKESGVREAAQTLL